MVVVCPKCGYERKEFDPLPDNVCPQCGIVYDKFKRVDGYIDIARRTGDWSKVPPSVMQNALKNMVVCTTQTIPGVEVEQVLEIVTAEVAFGMNLFRDFFASITDMTGGRSNSTQSVLRDARKQSLLELKKEALYVGGDAVIGVDLDYSEFSGGGKSMLFIVASGTAVRVSKIT